MPNGPWKSYDEWFGAVDGPILSVLNDDVQLKYQTYKSWVNKAGAGYIYVANALARFSDPVYRRPAPDPDGLSVPELNYTITPDLQKRIDLWKTLPPSTVGFHLSVGHDTGVTSTTDTYYGGHASWFGGFFGFGAGVSGSNHTFNTHDTHFLIDFRQCSELLL